MYVWLTSLWSGLTKYLSAAVTHRDVTQFVLDAAEVLDTPSKRNLWHFLLPRMSQEHQKYVRRHVTIPQSQREGGCRLPSWSLADSRAHSLTQFHFVNVSPLIQVSITQQTTTRDFTCSVSEFTSSTCEIMSFSCDDTYQWNRTSSDPVRLVSNLFKTRDNRQNTCIHDISREYTRKHVLVERYQLWTSMTHANWFRNGSLKLFAGNTYCLGMHGLLICTNHNNFYIRHHDYYYL